MQMPSIALFRKHLMLLGAACLWLQSPALSATPLQTSHQNNSFVQPGRSIQSTQSLWLTKRTRSYDISVSYPRVTDLSNAVKLNRLIKKVVQAKVGNYCRQDFSAWQKGSPRGHFVGNYQMLSANPHGLSIRFNFNTYYPDAATTSDEIECLNLDPQTGAVFTLDRIFKDGIVYPQVLSVLTLHQLINAGQGSELTAIPEAIAAQEASFRNFGFSSSDLMIFIKEPGLEPDAHDIKRIDLPLARLTNLLSDRFKHAIAGGNTLDSTDLPRLEVDSLNSQLAQLSIGSLSVMITNHPEEAKLYKLRAKFYQELRRQGPAESDLARAKSLDADEESSQATTTNEPETRGNSPEAKM
jgi:hypothetical protein